MEEKKIFVTDDKGIHKPAKLDKTDIEIIAEVQAGGGIPIESLEELQAIGKAACERFEGFAQDVQQMTKEQAEFIRKLRVDEGYSWRSVARTCYGNPLFKDWKNKKNWDPPSNQLMGMALCEKAAQFFGEEYMKEPWN